MIAALTGVLRDRHEETLVIETAGGVAYAVTVPLGVLERLPAAGAQVRLHTELVVREDGWALYGFDRAQDRVVFQRLLTASGFGPRLALAVLSTLGPDRAVRSIQGRDVAALATVTGIGRKKAERLILELHDRFQDLAVEAVPGPGRPAEEAVRALSALGYAPAAAEEAVRQVLEPGTEQDAAQLVRRALQLMTTSRGGA